MKTEDFLKDLIDIVFQDLREICSRDAGENEDLRVFGECAGDVIIDGVNLFFTSAHRRVHCFRY
jgi:hypothetical protein